ncbi:MAG TPA: FHA domain-containing protein, partial [Planctomycetaceae bacterium]
MQVSLELSGHPKANVQKVILSDTTLVGRSRSCGLQIASAAVSRKHCEIRLNGESVSVIDLGSSNGTFVDAERLPAGEERALRPGCRLNIGGVRFLVRYEPAGT